MKEEIRYKEIKDYSRFSLTNREIEEVHLFLKENNLTYKEIELEFTHNEIGTHIVIRSSRLRKERNITDYEKF